jgi:hypothetical protein
MLDDREYAIDSAIDGGCCSPSRWSVRAIAMPGAVQPRDPDAALKIKTCSLKAVAVRRLPGKFEQ